ncbi:TetR/AcrR family transcriptional regulator [Geosporobacter ferrireducens]|uniref:TetR family transcriptional regulator n=1 Tax=Geosporobacter ferrireducens TaxID=1424294 RepID=A0A1D8GEQ6_9FIRM|nr:TetR/AcrR family transcriptional regulator [Geosporobacter ferrireducens]AOT69360.1 TetR family transcriptional regulator [Geosporobacter ferrireducens]MTI57048.1 TetR/AcrR family transcriptional regulator [Geosporobacter ferrireducens]
MATQSEIKYNRLMEKAEELFIKLGYKAVSMDDIAEAAGISKMTIYKHFSSKEDLFLKVTFSLMEKNSRLIDQEMKNISGVLEKIDFLMNYNMKATKDFSLAFYRDAMSIPYITEKLLEEKYKISREMFERIIREGMEKGEIRKVNVKFVTDMLIMIVGGFAECFLDKINSMEEIDQVVADFYDFLKYGLLGGHGVK